LQLLVKIVKETQRRGSAGSKGPWKTFLATLPREDSAKPVQNDPARRDWETLSAFCATLTSDEDVNLVQRMRDWHAWLREEQRLEKEDPFPMSPEQVGRFFKCTTPLEHLVRHVKLNDLPQYALD
jgi:hypothetical protein